jgi:hypothetical protein
MISASRHQCLIYDGPPSRHLPAIASVIRQKLKENHRCLYLNSPSMVTGLKSRLAADGLDVIAEIARGSLVLTSEQHHLRGGWEFDIETMVQMLQRALEQALSDGYEGLWATGDMTWEFGRERQFSKLLDYELRLEDFIRENPQMGGVCQYHADTLPHEVLRKGLIAHRELFINETLSRINPLFLQRDASTQAPPTRAEMEDLVDQVLAQASLNQAESAPGS